MTFSKKLIFSLLPTLALGVGFLKGPARQVSDENDPLEASMAESAPNSHAGYGNGVNTCGDSNFKENEIGDGAPVADCNKLTDHLDNYEGIFYFDTSGKEVLEVGGCGFFAQVLSNGDPVVYQKAALGNTDMSNLIKDSIKNVGTGYANYQGHLVVAVKATNGEPMACESATDQDYSLYVKWNVGLSNNKPVYQITDRAPGYYPFENIPQ